MKFKQVKEKVMEILKPKDLLDELFMTSTSEIRREIGYPRTAQSWVRFVLNCMEKEGLLEKEKRPRACYWRIKQDEN